MTKVVYNTYPTAFVTPGGGERQLLKTLEYINRLGRVEAELFDQWAPKFSSAQLAHYFSVYAGSEVFMNAVKLDAQLPMVLSPILWLDSELEAQERIRIRHLFSRSDRWLVNSKAEADNIRTRLLDGMDDRFTVIPNAVDRRFFEPADPALFFQQFGLPAPFVLTVANIDRRKNLTRLLEACESVGSTLVQIGQVRDGALFRELKARFGPTFHPVGVIEHGSDLHRSALAACAVFALPSLYETPGLAALEAGAAGARVVVTQVGGAPEYFAGFAAYVDPLSTDSIATALRTVLEPSYHQHLGLREHLLEHFTWEQTALKTCEAYEKVLG